MGDPDQGEDKMEKGAKREGLSPKQIADKYIALYEADLKKLNISDPTHKPKATECVGEMIDMVKTLVEKGFTYQTPLAIYFDVSKFKNYTELSGQKLENLIKGAGTGKISDKNKKSPLDFAL